MRARDIPGSRGSTIVDGSMGFLILLSRPYGWPYLAIICCVALFGRRAVPVLPAIGIVLSMSAILWGALHVPPGMTLLGKGYWLGLAILPTAGVCSTVWAAKALARDPTVSRSKLFVGAAFAGVAGRFVGFCFALFIGCFAGWGCL
jgi:hypothetical protein